MKKFEPIFSDRCFPVNASRKLYDVRTCVQFLSRTEMAEVYKTYDPKTNSWLGYDNRDAKFGTYGISKISNNIFINPIYNVGIEQNIAFVMF